MTKIKAREILDLSKSASLKTAEQAYLQRQRKLQGRICPGNPRLSRQQAQFELAELTEAWNTMKTVEPRAKRKPAINNPAPVNQQPQNLADMWDLLFSLLPFPKPFVVSVIVTVFLITLISLAFNL